MSRTSIRIIIFRTLITFFLLAIVCAVYWLGKFAILFENNMCYSEVIHAIADRAEADMKSNTERSAAEFRSFVDSLPLYGYETSCEEVNSKLKDLKDK